MTNPSEILKLGHSRIFNAYIKPEGREIRWLPIETFRKSPHAIMAQRNDLTYFKSSGTTDTNRAFSFFSESGLAQYKHNSITTFARVLSQFFENPMTTKGFSLIPPTIIWKHSSLSQMIAWLGETWPITYTNTHDLHQDIVRPGTRSWVFGTAQHFLEIMNSLSPIQLPPGTVVIETGGLKKQEGLLNISSFHQRLSDFFAIPKRSILSEYSMCELASQAYTSCEKPSRFNFPNWVKLYIQGANSSDFYPTGKGCLVIDDKSRLDYPYPLRTQDIVQLYPDQSFEILGRVPSAPLRGCSLNALTMKDKSVTNMLFPKQSRADRDQLSRAALIIPQFVDFLTKPETTEILAKIIGSPTLAKEAIEDAMHFFPIDPSMLARSASKSLSDPKLSHDDWLLLANSTHPMALLEPLIFSYVLNMRIKIKLSKKHVELFRQFFATFPQTHFTFINESQPSSEWKGIQNVLCFGSDKSIAALRSEISPNLSGFGDFLSASLIRKDDLLQKIGPISRDYFALNQRGCFSSRIVIIRDPYCSKTAKQFTEQFLLHNSNNLQEHDFASQLALNHEKIRLLEEKASYCGENMSSKLLIYSIERFESLKLGTHKSLLPLVWAPNLSEFLGKLPIINRIGISRSCISEVKTIDKCSPNTNIVELGKSNCNAWDGFHQGLPFFHNP